MKSLPFYMDAPECFERDCCVLCNEEKTKSKVICEKCNDLCLIELGIRVKSILDGDKK